MIRYALNWAESRFWVALVFGFYQSGLVGNEETEIAKFTLKLADTIDGLCLPWHIHYCPPNFIHEHISVRACDVPVIMNRAKKMPEFNNFILVKGFLYCDQDISDCIDYDLFNDRGYITRPSPEWLLIEKEGDIFERDLEYLPTTMESAENLYYLYRAGFFDKHQYKKAAVWKKVVEMCCRLDDRLRGKRLKILY